MKKIACALICGGLAGVALAIDLPAPDADGKLVLNVAGGEYVATANVMCTQVVFGAANISVDLSAGGGKTIAIPSTVTSDGFAFSANGLSARVLGGIWDFGGNASLQVGINTRENQIEFSSTKIQSVKGIVIGNGKRDCALTLTDGAKLGAESLRISSAAGHHCTFAILSGSTASFSANFVPDEGQIDAQGGNLLKIDGEGSALSVPNKSVLLGRGRANDRMVVSNKGSVSLLNLAIGGTFTKNEKTVYATDTVLTVDDATLKTTQYLTIGSNAGGSTGLVSRSTIDVGTDATVGSGATSVGNLLSVSGSVMTVTGALAVGSNGSSGNRAEFRDVQLSANSIRIGLGADSINNTLVLAGGTTWTQTKADTDANHPFFFGDAGNNEVVLTDGFQFAPSDEYVMAASGNNEIHIRNGAKVTKDSGSWRIGQKDSKCHDNTVFAEAGGTASVYRVYLAGSRNRIVVSNGVFRVLRKDITSLGALSVGYDTNDLVSNPTVGCELVLRGTKPQYSSVGETMVCGDGKGVLRFELPAGELETVPMSCGMITVEEDAAIHVECDDYLSYLGDERGTLVLARASDKSRITIPQSVLDAANAELPERCKLVVSGTDLLLKTRGNKGLLLIFR